MKKKLIKNTVANILLQIITIISAFIIPRLVIYNYGSEYNGLISSINQFIGYISLLDVGISGVVRAKYYKALAADDQIYVSAIYNACKSLYNRIAQIFIFFILALLVIYPSVVKDFSFKFTAAMILILGITTFAEYFIGASSSLLIAASQRGYIISLLAVSRVVLSTIVTILFVNNKISILYLRLSIAAITVLSMLGQYLIAKKLFRIDKSVEMDESVSAERWNAAVHTIANFVHSNTDIVLITIFCGLKEVSVYSVYILVLNGVFKIYQSLFDGFQSLIGTVVNIDELSSIRKKFSLYESASQVVAISLYVTCGTMIVSFITLYMGDVNDANYVRFGFAVLYTASELFNVIKRPYFDLIRGVGRFKETRHMAITEAVINIGVSIILIYNFGLVGIAAGTLFAMIYRSFANMVYANSIILSLKNKYIIKRIISIFISLVISTIVAITIYVMWPTTVLSYLTWGMKSIVIGASVFAVSALVYIIMYVDDFLLLKKFIKKRDK